MRGKTLAEPRTARVVLGLPTGELELELEVPPGLARVDQLLPMARALTEQIVDLTVTQVEEEGRKISCRAGCGACCRQLVPIAEAEARGIRDLVASLPEPRRSQVKARFAEALLRLDAAGLLAPLRRGLTGTTPAGARSVWPTSARAFPAPFSKTSRARSILSGRSPAASTWSPRPPSTAPIPR